MTVAQPVAKVASLMVLHGPNNPSSTDLVLNWMIYGYPMNGMYYFRTINWWKIKLQRIINFFRIINFWLTSSSNSFIFKNFLKGSKTSQRDVPVMTSSSRTDQWTDHCIGLHSPPNSPPDVHSPSPTPATPSAVPPVRMGKHFASVPSYHSFPAHLTTATHHYWIQF